MSAPTRTPSRRSRPCPRLMDRASRLRRLIHSVSRSLRWLPPSVARLTVGWVFLQSGWGKLQNLPKVVGVLHRARHPAPAVPGAARRDGGVRLRRAPARRAVHPGGDAAADRDDDRRDPATAKKADIQELSDLFGMGEYLYIALLPVARRLRGGPDFPGRRVRPTPRPRWSGRCGNADRPQDFSEKLRRPPRKGGRFACSASGVLKTSKALDGARSTISALACGSRRGGPLVAPRAPSVPGFACRPRASVALNGVSTNLDSAARAARACAHAVRILPRLVLAHRGLGPRRPVFPAWHSRCSPEGRAGTPARRKGGSEE